MTHILLISDTERVKRVFESIEKKGPLRLRTATTLIQADQEISGSAPEFTFVQSRISGFSGEIILRHLKKNLPEGAKIILLAGDADEVKQANKHAELHLDLTLDDEALAGCIADILGGVCPPRESASPAKSSNPKVSDGPESDDNPKPGDDFKSSPDTRANHDTKPSHEFKASPEPMASHEFEASAAPKGGHGSKVKHNPKHNPKQSGVTNASDTAEQEPIIVQPEALAEPPADQSGPGSVNAGIQSFAEIMRLATSTQEEPPAPVPFQADEQVNVGTHLDSAARLSLTGQAEQEEPAKPMYVGEFTSGEPLADAMRRAQEKKRRPRWIFALAFAFICIPAICYLAGKKSAPPELTSGPRTAAKSLVKPAPAQIAKSVPPPATQPAAKPVTPATSPVAKPEAKPAAKTVAKLETKPVAKPVANPEAKPVAKAGLKSLPPIVSQTELDASYGKSHPGWQRYLGTHVEFKVFKEAELYRALQVLERNGEPIPDQIFKRVLAEFGGADSYQVKSTGAKGKYLVEQGTTQGDVSITVYRNKGDRRMKAFVLYYR